MTRSLRFVSLAACYFPLGTPPSFDLNLHTTKTHWPIIQKVTSHLIEIPRVPEQSNFKQWTRRSSHVLSLTVLCSLSIIQVCIHGWRWTSIIQTINFVLPTGQTVQSYGASTLCGPYFKGCSHCSWTCVLLFSPIHCNTDFVHHYYRFLFWLIQLEY